MIAFFGQVDEIKRNLVQFNDNVDRIENLHQRSLTEIASEESEQWTQKQLESLVDDTSSLSQDLKTRIKTLEAKSLRDPTKMSQVENVKKQFKDSIQKYQAIEATYRQRYREAAERQFRIVRPEATDAEVQEAVENSSSPVFANALMTSNRRGQQARTALTEVQTRHQEIEKIEKTMAELAQLFQDMEMLVAEQEQPVAHIEEQAQTVQRDIEQGVAHTSKAIVSAKAARRKKWWCLAIVLIIIAVVAIVLGVHFGK
jgi:syntaxin 1B/2/3